MIDLDSNILEQAEVDKEQYDRAVPPPNKERAWKKISGVLAISYLMAGAHGGSAGFWTASKLTGLASAGIIAAGGLIYIQNSGDDTVQAPAEMVEVESLRNDESGENGVHLLEDKSASDSAAEGDEESEGAEYLNDGQDKQHDNMDTERASRVNKRGRRARSKRLHGNTVQKGDVVPELSSDALDVAPSAPELKANDLYARGLKTFREKKYDIARSYFEEYERRFPTGSLIVETKTYLLDIASRQHYPRTVMRYAAELLSRDDAAHRQESVLKNYLNAALELDQCAAAAAWLQRNGFQKSDLPKHACRDLMR